jgi:two-component system, LytTR family, response regulator
MRNQSEKNSFFQNYSNELETDKSATPVIRALIVDDEEGARDIMEHLLKKFPDVEVVGKASSADEALEMIIRCMPDLVFLDVQMPEKNGFHLVEYLQKYLFSTHVIFVTAHAKFAIDALKVAAFDYLLKPVLMSELQETILRFKATQVKKSAVINHEQPVEKSPRQCKLKFNTRTGYILVSPEEIMYCEADVNYTTLYFGKDNREVITMNLGRVEEILALHSFYRISRSILINRQYLCKADRQKKHCILEKGNERIVLEISPTHIRELEKFLDELVK